MHVELWEEGTEYELSRIISYMKNDLLVRLSKILFFVYANIEYIQDKLFKRK